jgi:hypothetical protein
LENSDDTATVVFQRKIGPSGPDPEGQILQKLLMKYKIYHFVGPEIGRRSTADEEDALSQAGGEFANLEKLELGRRIDPQLKRGFGSLASTHGADSLFVHSPLGFFAVGQSWTSFSLPVLGRSICPSTTEQFLSFCAVVLYHFSPGEVGFRIREEVNIS